MSATSEKRHDRESGDPMELPLSPKLLWRVLASLGRYKWLVFVGNALCFTCVAADMAMIGEIRRILDRADLATASVWSLTAMLLFYCLLNRVTGSAQWLVTNYATNRALENLRRTYFEKLESLSCRFFDQHKAGWLVARNTGDMQVVWQFMTFGLMVCMIFLASMSFALVEMARITPILLLPCAVIAPGMLCIAYRYKRSMSRTQRDTREQNSRLVAAMAETVRGIRVVHAYGREEKNLETFSDLNRRNHDLEVDVARLNGLFLPSLDLAGVLNMTVAVAFGSWLIGRGYLAGDGQPLTAGDLAAYILYSNSILFPLRMVMEVYSLALGAGAAAERLFEIIDMDPEVQDPPDPLPCDAIRGRIEFRGVGFRYGPEEAWVLRGLDLDIAPGQTVAIVGETGAGKTTIANLTARFYDVQEGAVCIDGVDVRRYGQSDLHRHMGIVLQQGYLFTGTILDNLRFGRPDLSDEAIVETARRLGTEKAIAALPEGFRTRVLEGGDNLSLGQRQLIAVTRAVAADPSILILDEPTSALDVYAERLLQQALEEMVRGRTTLVIAHRLSTVRNVDRILVMDQGRIVEDGSHDELVARGGRYLDLVLLQDGE